MIGKYSPQELITPEEAIALLNMERLQKCTRQKPFSIFTDNATE